MIPLISGATTGPLGIVHLPRLWLKLRLHACGRLPAGYRHGNGGSDEALLTTFGIDGNAFTGFVAASAPDYLALEAWVRAHARDLRAATIAEFNAQTLVLEMPEPRKSEWTARFGLPIDWCRSIDLNQLDDWDLVHAALAAPDAPATDVVPAISSSVAGPLGAMHLPRLWLKLLLASYGRLPEGYRHGSGRFDEDVLMTTLGIDGAAMIAYVDAARPGYQAFEAWVREHAANPTPEAIADLNAQLLAAKMPQALGDERRARFGISDPSFDRGIPLNDLDDWAGLHACLAA